MGASSSQQTERVTSNEQANGKAELSNENESTATVVTVPPSIFTTKHEFVTTWFSWKKEFLAYLRYIDKAEDKKHMWGIMLLNRMGPVGQEIHRTFPFYDKNMEDIDILIKKFDIYCLYGNKKRGCEDINKYINDLKFFAIAQDYIDPISIVKEKIIQDISTQRFTGKAALLIERKGENLIPYLQSLDLYHITLFWKQCEDLTTQRVKETPKQDFSYVKSTALESTQCDLECNRSRCTAWGHRFRLYLPKLCCSRCDKCKQVCHFTGNCKNKYIDDCTKCGMSHIQSHCPAYGELCGKCGQRNHFSWKCQIPFIINCSKCGMNHAVTMCPAQGRICSRCNKRNHLEEQCPNQPSV